MSARIAVIIPARYGSTRFPGKPLEPLGRTSVLGHVVACAREGVRDWPDAQVAVATDDARIMDHAASLGVEAIMTPDSCRTGTDRVHAAVQHMAVKPDIIVNLQGDAPFTPAEAVRKSVGLLVGNSAAEVATPVVPLRWEELDELRRHKELAPHSGTTAVLDKAQERALWFSKLILPAMRHEDRLRAQSSVSPVLRHIGLYAYRAAALEAFVNYPETTYERLEGLEQLRMLEHGMNIYVTWLDNPGAWALGGIDTPEDLRRANQHVMERGL